ncbi:MAG TPA: hypothetical protein PLA83_09915 [Deltaproteobacteria bacterium]|jgi:hypothetical protein|nr:hypothetical protein [Deltaproteobacteria bacterium]HQI02049.1 hypothetical protein [Deltaproteobacteria bacterium]HQJ08024.1 hypothetical protein [Deltaproteobacteria bacterium]
MSWKILPALAYITFFNLAVSCIDDFFVSSASSGNGLDAAFVCSSPVKADPLDEEAFREIFLGGELRWDKDGGIVLAIIREGEVSELFPEKTVAGGPR